MCLFHVTYFDMQIIINMQQICKLTQYTIFLWFFEHIFTTFAWKEFAVLLPNHNHRKTDSLGVAMPSFLSPFIILSLFSSFCCCLKQKIPHKIWMETDSYVDSWTTIYRPQYHTTATNPNIFTHLASPKKKKWPPYFCLNEFNNLWQPCHTQSPDGPCYVNILSSVHAVGLFTAYKWQRWRASGGLTSVCLKWHELVA